MSIKTKYLKENQIKKGADIIKSGGLVAFRTETVYGLGADATNAEAVAKIFEAKGRPARNPLIVHFASLRDCYSFFGDEIDESTKTVLSKVKGALTVILPRIERIPEIVSGGLDTVAVRIPSCRFAKAFIRASGVALAAPSANTSGRPSPTKWQHVRDDLDGTIDAIFMGKRTRIGVESTVVKVEGDRILVLRLGGTNTKKLAKRTGMKVVIANEKVDIEKSPGTSFKHYAPKCEFFAVRDLARVQTAGKGKCLILRNADLGKSPSKNLFSLLRESEDYYDTIICELFPEKAEYEAVNERITRAADGKVL